MQEKDGGKSRNQMLVGGKSSKTKTSGVRQNGLVAGAGREKREIVEVIEDVTIQLAEVEGGKKCDEFKIEVDEVALT